MSGSVKLTEMIRSLERERDEARAECERLRECDKEYWKLCERNMTLEAENERLRAALQTIADDPIVRPHREEKRSISEILAIARAAIDAARR